MMAAYSSCVASSAGLRTFVPALLTERKGAHQSFLDPVVDFVATAVLYTLILCIETEVSYRILCNQPGYEV